MTERIFAFDLETTGLDLRKDRILKLGFIVSNVGKFYSHLENEITLYEESYPPIHSEALKVHGLDFESIKEFGADPRGVYVWLAGFMDQHRITHIVSHNLHRFDLPMLKSNVDCYYPDLNDRIDKCIKIDTMTDLPVEGRRLTYMAADHGFLNPFPHSSLSDVKTMLKIMDQYIFDDIVTRAKSPLLTIQAHVDYAENALAKSKGFRWDADNKRWSKQMKKVDFENESFQFRASVVGGQ